MTSLFARDIPSSFRTSLTDFFTDRITSETDFLNEVSNAEHMREHIRQEPKLRDVVHIPKTYSALCTKRVMVAEWIDGFSIAETELLTGPWKNNAAIGTPTAAKGSSTGPKTQELYGLGLRGKDVMSVMLDLFCAQAFLFGQVHCDPVNNCKSTSTSIHPTLTYVPSTPGTSSLDAFPMANLNWYVVAKTLISQPHTTKPTPFH